jgi:glycosyltransferase involved in cell wall biosynthesis
MVNLKQNGVLPMGEKGERSYSPTLVLIAALNEEEGIGLTIAELRKYLCNLQFLVVDGRSKDKTVDVAKSLGADVIYQEGKGKGDAIGYAIKNVNKDVEYVVLIDADYTYPAEFVPRMLKLLEKNPRVGMVIGNRFNHFLAPAAMKHPFYVGNRLLAVVQRFLNGVDLNDPLTGLRVVRWHILRDWKPRSKGFDFEAELNLQVERRGYQIVEVSIPYRERLGEKKLKLRHGFSILIRIVEESFRYSIERFE